MPLEEPIRNIIETFQRIEITEHYIYKNLARSIKEPENSKILDQIADDELRHYNDWKAYTQKETVGTYSNTRLSAACLGSRLASS